MSVRLCVCDLDMAVWKLCFPLNCYASFRLKMEYGLCLVLYNARLFLSECLLCMRMCSSSPLLPSVCGVMSCAGSDGHSNPSLDNAVVPPAVNVDALLRKKRQSSSSTFFLELYVATDTAAVSSASPHA